MSAPCRCGGSNERQWVEFDKDQSPTEPCSANFGGGTADLRRPADRRPLDRMRVGNCDPLFVHATRGRR